MTRVALLQLSSGSDRRANLAQIDKLLGGAATAGAELALLPEACAYRGPFRPELVEGEDGPTLTAARSIAARTGMAVLVGGLWTHGPDPRHPYNTSVLVDGGGDVKAAYRKVHLFQIDAGEELREQEADFTTPGDSVVTVAWRGWILGLSICYDLRFPELYRALVGAGATLLCVPSNFTLHTGRDHWEPLLRARAIENLAYVLAPAQVGLDPAGGAAYGHSLAVDPWGTVICQAVDEVALITADLDPSRITHSRSVLNALDHRRPDVFPEVVRAPQFS